MKEIKLTQGLFALVDDNDFEYLNQFKWFAYKGRNTFYAGRTIRSNGMKRNIRMHREIMNTPEIMEVDHIDHNGLNNQKCNLRNCNNIENQRNRNIQQGSSRYKGVHVRKNGRISANIRVNKSLIYLGDFSSEYEAALAYDKAASNYFGPFCKMNFIYEEAKSI